MHGGAVRLAQGHRAFDRVSAWKTTGLSSGGLRLLALASMAAQSLCSADRQFVNR